MKTTTVTLSIALAVVLVVVMVSLGGDARAAAAGGPGSSLKITLEAGGFISPDGLGAYVNGVSGVTATYTASTGTVTFGNAALVKGKTGRSVYVNLDDPVDVGDPSLGVRQVYLASWMKPIDNADGFYDMRVMEVGDITPRKWNVQWPGSNYMIDTYHLHWDSEYFPADADVELRCTAQGTSGTGPCTAWEARPAGAAGLRHVIKISKGGGVVSWADDGLYNVPFVLTIVQQ
jgi:hypothetical protein